MCQHQYQGYNPELNVSDKPDIFDRIAEIYNKNNPTLTKEQARKKAIKSMTYTLGDDDW
jgi:hypothetical protein